MRRQELAVGRMPGGSAVRARLGLQLRLLIADKGQQGSTGRTEMCDAITTSVAFLPSEMQNSL